MSESGLAHDLAEFVEVRAAGEHVVDAWGFDRGVYDLAARLGHLRWGVRTEGAENLPASGPALLVVNRRFGVSEPAVLAMGIHEATGRHVRPVGIPDVPIASNLLRRLGGVLDAPAEIRSLLRSGAMVAVPCSRQPLHASIPGVVRSGAFEAAVAVDAPVFAVAVTGHEWGVAWQVRVGTAVRVPRARRGGRAVALADAARDALRTLLEQA